MYGMDKKEKEIFIKELADSVIKMTIQDIAKMPDEWNGKELRWLLAERFENATMSKKDNRKDYREFYNYCLVNNL